MYIYFEAIRLCILIIGITDSKVKHLNTIDL